MPPAPPSRSGAWKWWICGLLLLATTINYMDRQTLANAAVRISDEFRLSKQQYGNLELAFGWAFGVGSLLFGFIADRVNVRWLYPTALFAWSLMGFLSAQTTNFHQLLVCRTLLGLFEAGHWPCALKTTHLLLSAQDRTMGNSVLQSGASIGAIITPLVMRALMTDVPGTWRLPFQVIGAVGILWVIAWLTATNHATLSTNSHASPNSVENQATILPLPKGEGRGEGEPSLRTTPVSTTAWTTIFTPRFLALLILLLSIHITWQLLRVWLPMFLQKGRGYTETSALLFNSAYFLATDIGCLAAGAASLCLARRGLNPHTAKRRVFLVCALLTSLTVLVAVLPKGWPLLLTLLVVGAGALGVYPCYYSFLQEVSLQHTGKIYGLIAILVWAIGSLIHTYFGRYIDKTQSFDLGIALAGLTPILGFIIFCLLWNPRNESLTASSK